MTEVNRQAKPDMRPRCGVAVIELTIKCQHRAPH